MTIFFRLLEPDDKGTALHQAIQQLAQTQRSAERTSSEPQSNSSRRSPNPNTFAVEPESFQQVPGAPFAYWVSEEVRKLFVDFEKVESSGREARIGSSTGDDTRYIRIAWEIPSDQIGRGIRWVWLNKGGSASDFYFGYHLVIDWDEKRRTFRGFCGRIGRLIERPNGLEHFFRPGISWALRTQAGFNTRVMPVGMIFSHKRPTLFVAEQSELLALLAISQTKIFKSMVEIQISFGSYEVGAIQQTPIPDLTPESTATLASLARRAWSLKRSLDTVTQTSHAFILPALLQVNSSSLSNCSLSSLAKAWTDHVTAVESELAHIQTQIDDLVFNLYGISEGDRAGLNSSDAMSESTTDTDSDDDEEDSSNAADLPSLTSELLAYLLSVAFGRFDVRLATGDRPHPPEPEPFDPLPVCSPGMLVGDNGLPAIAPTELPPNYPIQIPFDGILVDDEGHSNDIINRIRDVLNVIWGEQDSDIEQEACHLLSTNGLRVSSLRDYFRKPTAFFNDHLSRYSKSRRQAPIYLPLSTRSGNYTFWLYYHRLTDQTLYTCINDYVEPKLARVKEQIEGIRRAVGSGQWSVVSDQKKTPTTDHRSLTTEIERLQDLESELEDFRDELQRIAQFWKPNLNDGVQITLSPLWSLFRLGKWQKKLKETWDKLEKGDYDWAHLAHSIWAKRVEEKCKKDKSLAIAHNLEHLYETPLETPKSTKRKKKE